MKRIGLALRHYDIEGVGDLFRLAGAFVLLSGAVGSGMALLMAVKFR